MSLIYLTGKVFKICIIKRINKDRTNKISVGFIIVIDILVIRHTIRGHNKIVKYVNSLYKYNCNTIGLVLQALPSQWEFNCLFLYICIKLCVG